MQSLASETSQNLFADELHMLYHSHASLSCLFEHVCKTTRSTGKNEWKQKEPNESFLAIKQNFQHLSLVIYRVA